MNSVKCAVCRKKFKPVNAVQKLCGPKCREERLRQQLKDQQQRRRKGWTAAPIFCAVCLNPFVPSNPVAKYCGDTCRKEGWKRALAEYRKGRKERDDYRSKQLANRAPAPPEQDS